MTPLLYLDPQSPYAYPAEARAASVLGAEPELQPLLLGAIFKRRGYGSWAHTPDRAQHVAILGDRLAAAGLPPLTLPDDWPAPTLGPARACLWAHEAGRGRDWLRAYWRAVFAEGSPAGAQETLEQATRGAGLAPGDLAAAIDDRDRSRRLRAATEQAWEDGVRGVPTIRLGDRLFYGDDQLEAAAGAGPTTGGDGTSLAVGLDRLPPYRPRHVTFLGVRELPGWTVKVHGISLAGAEGVAPALVEAGLHRAVGVLSGAAPGAHAIACLTLHDAADHGYALVSWWSDTNELHQQIFSAPAGDPGQMAPHGSPAIGCVWELAVTVHERRAWVEHVLRHPEAPRIEAYLADGLNADV